MLFLAKGTVTTVNLSILMCMICHLENVSFFPTVDTFFHPVRLHGSPFQNCKVRMTMHWTEAICQHICLYGHLHFAQHTFYFRKYSPLLVWTWAATINRINESFSTLNR